MIANVHVSWGNFITCLWNDVFQRTFRKWNATSRKRDHEDFLLGHWKNETIKLQALLANHDFRPMKNIPITEPLDYQQSECFGLFVFSFLLISLILLTKFIPLFLFCSIFFFFFFFFFYFFFSLEILETKSECTPRYDENWPMQDVGQSSSHVLFCTYRSREYRTVIRNVLLFENLMYSKLLSQNVAKKQCIGKKIVMRLRTTTGQQTWT